MEPSDEFYNSTYRILLVEDNPGDRHLMRALMVKGRISLDHYFEVGDLASALEALNELFPDVVLLDLGLPDTQGLDGVRKVVKEYPAATLLVVTGDNDPRKGLQAIQEGAQDYLVKGHITPKGLQRCIRYAIERKRLLREKEELVLDLKVAMNKIKTLKGIVPICAKCKNVRDDKGYWQKVEKYVSENSEAEFSHGLCPACMEEYMKELDMKWRPDSDN